MKKIYEKPTMGIYTIKAECMLDGSSKSIGVSNNNYNGSATIESNERSSIFSSDGNGYNRSLW